MIAPFPLLLLGLLQPAAADPKALTKSPYPLSSDDGMALRLDDCEEREDRGLVCEAVLTHVERQLGGTCVVHAVSQDLTFTQTERGSYFLELRPDADECGPTKTLVIDEDGGGGRITWQSYGWDADGACVPNGPAGKRVLSRTIRKPLPIACESLSVSNGPGWILSRMSWDSPLPASE